MHSTSLNPPKSYESMHVEDFEGLGMVRVNLCLSNFDVHLAWHLSPQGNFFIGKLLVSIISIKSTYHKLTYYTNYKGSCSRMLTCNISTIDSLSISLEYVAWQLLL